MEFRSFRYPLPSTDILYSVFTFSKEYWQLAMTRQNWNTQKSLKQPWLRSTKPRKETRNAMNTATRFSRTSWFLHKTTHIKTQTQVTMVHSVASSACLLYLKDSKGFNCCSTVMILIDQTGKSGLTYQK